MFITCQWGICGAFGSATASIILSAQTVVFIPQTNIAAGLNPVSLAIGDFRGDRKPDLAVADQGSATVPILLGLGNGFFQPLENLGVGIGPRAVAVGDFNRDGRLDLVVANFGSETVSLLLGNGNGTFRQGVTLEASGPSAVAVGDFNADGKLDLAVTNRNNNDVSIFLGVGEGFFLPALNFAVGVGPVSIAAGDFNADGNADLVVANETSNSVSVLLGNGNGTFQPALNFAAGLMPVSIALGDFNGDGKIDLAVVNATSAGTISLLLGNGRGIFQATLSFTVGANPSFVVSADFNLDGKLDLAVANAGSDTISVFMGTGRGIFLPGLDFATGDGPAWIGVTDLNADGKPDLMVANRLSSTVSVLINRTLVRDQPTIADHAVLNAASYQTSFLAPGELVTIFGSNLGPTQLAGPQLNASHRVDTTLAQTRVLFDGIPAPLIFVRADQVSAIVPYAVAGRVDTQVAVERNQVMSPALTIPVSESAPGLFTANASGRGPGAILNEDLSVNSAANPAARSSIVVLYGTGAGQTNPPAVDGELAGKVPPKPALPVLVTIDGRKAQVLYAGAISGVPAAVIQVNVRLPDGIHSGSVPVFLNVGGAASQQGVTLAVQ